MDWGAPLCALQRLLHLLHLDGQMGFKVPAQRHAGVLGRLPAGENLVITQQRPLVLGVQDFKCADLEAVTAQKKERESVTLLLLERFRRRSAKVWRSSVLEVCPTRLTRRRRPSCLSNSSKTARKEKEMEKNMVAWQQPEACEHSSSHSVYPTTSDRIVWGNMHTWRGGHTGGDHTSVFQLKQQEFVKIVK